MAELYFDVTFADEYGIIKLPKAPDFQKLTGGNFILLPPKP